MADGEILGERTTRPQSLLADVDALLAARRRRPLRPLCARRRHRARAASPGTRIGLAVARGLALSLDLPVAGVSTLAALASAADQAFPVIDARRGEVFVLGPLACRPGDVIVPPGWSLHRQTEPAATATSSRRAAPSCLPTTPTSMCHAPRSTPRSRRRSARPMQSIRSMSANPTPLHGRAELLVAAARARRPRRDRTDRAGCRTRPRGRARCSRPSWPSRARSRSQRSLPTGNSWDTSSCRGTSTRGT